MTHASAHTALHQRKDQMGVEAQLRVLRMIWAASDML